MLCRALAAALALASTPRLLIAQGSLSETYRETAGRILEAAMADEKGFKKLGYLTTSIGHRLSGSGGLERAIEWAYAEMRKEELDNVRKLPVQVPHWVRGRESARVVSPVAKEISILGLGLSIATPGGPLTAPVVAVRSFEELAALGRDAVRGKIVLYAVPCGADIGPLMADGVPGLGLRTVGDHYFDWHHTKADTLDKVDPDNLRRAMGLLAVMGFVLADMPGTLSQVASK